MSRSDQAASIRDLNDSCRAQKAVDRVGLTPGGGEKRKGQFAAAPVASPSLTDVAVVVCYAAGGILVGGPRDGRVQRR